MLIVDGGLLNLLAYFIGIFTVNLQSGDSGSEKILLYSTLTVITYPLGVLIYLLTSKKISLQIHLSEQKILSPMAIGLIGLLIIIGNIFFVVSVYDSLILSEKLVNLLSIRKAITSGQYGYFAPGLVKQIRDILAPAFLAYLIVYHSEKNLLKVLIFVSTFIAMFIGGQRFPFLILFISLIVAYKIKNNTSYIKKTRSWGMVFLYLGIMIGAVELLSYFLGREVDNYNNNFLQNFLSTIYNIFYRAVCVVPEENVRELPFLYSMNFSFASDWLNALSSIFIGHSNLAFTNELASYLGGEETGNAVLGFPLDVYVNCGIVGLLIIPAITAFLSCLLDRWVTSINQGFLSISKNIIIIYTLLWYSPYLTLLNGGLYLIFFILYFKLRQPLMQNM